MQFDGGTAVVTGAASGIGLAFARALGERGATVVMSDVDAGALATSASALSQVGLSVHAVPADVTDQRSVEELAQFVDSLGPLTVTCLNAGVCVTGSSTWLTDDATLDFVLRVNLWGVLHGLRSFVPRMMRTGQETGIVVTGSMAGLAASPNSAAYSASKAAVIALAEALRCELAVSAPRIRVALLNPGMVKTNLMRTSARLGSNAVTLGQQVVNESHAALNEFGEDPETTAKRALAALVDGRFWVLPPTGDPFVSAMRDELTELEASAFHPEAQ